MKRSSTNIRTSADEGFSLIEVALAMAIMAVGFIAIIGLIPQGVSASRSAADNTISATLVHDIFNTIRSQPFGTVKLGSFGFGTYDLTVSGSGSAYFDQSGFAPASAADNYYKVTLNFITQSPVPSSLVVATVTWPAKSATTLPPNTNTFTTLVAHYQ